MALISTSIKVEATTCIQVEGELNLEDIWPLSRLPSKSKISLLCLLVDETIDLNIQVETLLNLGAFYARISTSIQVEN